MARVEQRVRERVATALASQATLLKAIATDHGIDSDEMRVAQATEYVFASVLATVGPRFGADVEDGLDALARRIAMDLLDDDASPVRR